MLSFIVPKLTIQVENATTDCLSFIFSTYPRAAESLRGFLSPAGVSLPVGLEFTTQVAWEHGGGRPDLVGMSDDRACLIIEAKFFAPLTKNQPVDYVRHLHKDGGGVLLFLAPAARVTELWATLERRCRAARIPVGERAEFPNGLVSAALAGTHRLAIASWERLISTLLNDLSAPSDSDALVDVSQLNALCGRLLGGEIADIPGDPDWDKRDRQLRAMVDAVVARLAEDGYANTEGYRSTPGPGYYKRYMTLSGRKNWCVEFNSEYWARFGESLIWLSTSHPSASADEFVALDAMLANSARHVRKDILIPLRPTHARSEAEALERMVVQAAAVAKLLESIARPQAIDTP